MAVVIQGFEFALAGGTAATSVTVNKPAGVSVGDLLILLVGNEDNTATTSFANITGWTKQYEFGDATPDTKIGCYTRIADGTEGASETISWSATGADAGGAWYLRITGHDPINYWHVLGTPSQAATGTSGIAASITTIVPNCLVFAHHSFDGGDGNRTLGGDPGWPAAYPTNQVLYDTTGATAWSGGWITQDLATATASGSATFTSSVSDGNVQVQFAIAPVSGPSIINVTPNEFNFGSTGTFQTTIIGQQFGATQGSSTVYISDIETLGFDEVEIPLAIASWSDTAIDLDFSLLSPEASLALQNIMGPGDRFVLVDIDGLGTTVLTYPILLHRPHGFIMTAGAATPGDTTQRLTGLAGTFSAGRIEETINPSTTSNVFTADGNREDVWSIAATPEARDVRYDFRVVYNGSVFPIYTRVPNLLVTGGLTVTPFDFSYDELTLDLSGTGFGATQGTSTVYISDQDTQGSVNEVEVSSAVETWSNSLITLNLTLLGPTEFANLNALGVGMVYFIVKTSTEEFNTLAISHRAHAFRMSAGAATPGGTTARLTGMTGTFGGGRLEELINPQTISTDIASNQWREDVWSMVVTGFARQVTYDFRVLVNGEFLDAYVVTPSLIVIVATGNTAGYIKYWDGNAWQLKPVKFWDGSTWQLKPIKYYDGAAWTLVDSPS